MPYVNIRIAKGGVTTEQKGQLIQGATQLLKDVLNKDPKSTYVVIDEVDTDNWGVGGQSLTAIRGTKDSPQSGLKKGILWKLFQKRQA